MESIPEGICGTYRRYKEGTNKIFAWIYENASEPIHERSKKSSSRTNKQTTDDWIRLAKRVAAAKSTVPSDILRNLKNVISARSACGSWYRKYSASKDTESNKEKDRSHEHFIGILKEVHAILKTSGDEASLGNQKKDKNKPSTKPENGISLENQFKHLEIEDIVDDSAKTTKQKDHQKVPTKKATTAKYTDNKETIVEEKLFALFCFFQDAEAIQWFVFEIWRKYNLGECGLTSASMTTNTAFNLVRQMNEDLIAAFPDLNDHQKVINFIESNGFDIRVPRLNPYNGHELDTHMHTEDETPWALRPENQAKLELNNRLCLSIWDTILGSDLTKRGFFPELVRLESCCCIHRRLDDARTAAVEYTFIADGNPHYISYQIITGFLEARKSGNFPSWLVSCFTTVTMLWDTIEPDNIYKAYDEFQAYCVKATQMLSGYMKFSKDFDEMGFATLPVYHENNQAALFSIVRWIAVLTKRDLTTEIKERFGASASYQIEKHWIMKYDMVMSGLIMSELKLKMHLFGSALAAHDNIIFDCVHIYNAGLQCGKLKQKWQDMEDLISIHAADKNIFLGGRPTTARDCGNRWYLTRGMSTTALANGKTLGTYLGPAAKLPSRKQNTKMMGPTSQYFLQQAVQSKEGKFYTSRFPHNIVDILPRIVEAQIRRYLDMKARNILTEYDDPNLDQAIIEKWQKDKQLDPLQLLVVFFQCFEADDFHLEFDYFAMTRRCAEILYEARTGPANIMLRNLDQDPGYFITPSSALSGYATGHDLWPLTIFCLIMLVQIKTVGGAEHEKNPVPERRSKTRNELSCDDLPMFPSFGYSLIRSDKPAVDSSSSEDTSTSGSDSEPSEPKGES